MEMILASRQGIMLKEEKIGEAEWLIWQGKVYAR